MRRLFSLVPLFWALAILSACTPKDGVLSTLPPWESREFYTAGGFQDYTDYGKYHYTGLTPTDFAQNPCFEAMTAQDCAELLLYAENFAGWVSLAPEDSGLARGYDFDPAVVGPGDMVYIISKHPDTDRRFDSYTVYFFDMDGQTLYYFHSNI